MLKGSDRTVGVGEGSLKVRQHLGHGSVSGRRGRLGWRTTPSQQSGAEGALAEEESSPELLPGAGREPAVDSACGSGDAVGDNALQEPPHQPRGHAHTPDFIGTPNADRASATRADAAVTAKDSPSPNGFFSGRCRRHNRGDSRAGSACRRVPYRTLIAFSDNSCRIGVRSADVCYVENSANGGRT